MLPFIYINLVVAAITSVDPLELVLDPLDLRYLGIQNGDKIPCFFSRISACRQTQGPFVSDIPSTTNRSPPGAQLADFQQHRLKNANHPPTKCPSPQECVSWT
jgi:hypothetical protein